MSRLRGRSWHQILFPATLVTLLMAGGCDSDNDRDDSSLDDNPLSETAPLDAEIQGAINKASTHFASLGIDPNAGRILVFESPDDYDVSISFESERGLYGTETHVVVSKASGDITQTYQTR